MTKNPYAVKIMEKDTAYFAAEKIISFQRPDSLDINVKKSFLRAYKKPVSTNPTHREEQILLPSMRQMGYCICLRNRFFGAVRNR